MCVCICVCVSVCEDLDISLAQVVSNRAKQNSEIFPLPSRKWSDTKPDSSSYLTFGTWADEANKFLKTIAKRLSDDQGRENASDFLTYWQ